MELGTGPIKDDLSVPRGSTYSSTHGPIYDEQPANYFRRIRDSFKRDPSRRITPQDPKNEAEARAAEGRAAHSGHYYDIHQAMLQTAHSGLARKLKGRHLQMIAIGGSIGTT